MKKFIFLALCSVLSAPAYAHVTANPNEAVAGKYFQTSFRVSHGCEGSDTIALTVKIPKGITSLKPEHKAGWEIDIKKSKLDKPVPAGHGKMATEQFDEITWRGGKLPDAYYDEFGIVLKLPEKQQTLWFPVTQTCEKGSLNWVDIPKDGQQWHDVKSPAPFVTITPAAPAVGHRH